MVKTWIGKPKFGNKLPQYDGTYGPQAPRIKRLRYRVVAMPRESISFIAKPSEAFPNGSISTAQNTVKYTVESCIDTVRNPNFRGPRELISDDGGILTIRKSHWQPANAYISSDWQGNTRTEGDLWLNFYGEFHDGSSTSGDLPPNADTTILDALGPAAWNSFKPTKPWISLGVAIAELRELPRMLTWRLAELKDLKGINDYFLALTYGWGPLWSDLKRALKVYERLSKHIDFLIANTGKPVRRSGRLSSTTDSGLLWEEGGLRMRNTAPDLGKPSLSSAWRQSSRFTKTQKIWFSGEYVFWIDDVRWPNTRAHLGAGLVGLRITPADVWDALPWTWLIDWYLNIGDILANIKDQVAERTVSKYAYLMGQTNRVYTQHTTDGYYSVALSHHFETKVRRKVDPFGLAPEVAITPLQVAILGALAIQRV